MTIEDMREAVSVSERLAALEATHARLTNASQQSRLTPVVWDGKGGMASLDVSGKELARFYAREIRAKKAELAAISDR